MLIQRRDEHSPVLEPVRNAQKSRKELPDEARFLRSWLERPLVTGAVSPSGKVLARTMAGYVDPAIPGPIIELGPGTGPVTEALLRRGIAEERLVLVEFNPEFCTLLRKRFPKATVVQGDAYRLDLTLADLPLAPVAAVVSGLPLFTKPPAQRMALVNACFDRMRPDAPLIQFTYAVVSPVPLGSGPITGTPSSRIWLNLPPARVWVYRRRES